MGKKDKGLGGLPRKCFKRLIKKELDKQCSQIFNNLMNCRELGQNGSNHIDQSNLPVHDNIICDGCKICPIIGPRYKCSVLKNFDYCSMCEERRQHDYAFLKINRPS